MKRLYKFDPNANHIIGFSRLNIDKYNENIYAIMSNALT